MCRCDKCGGGHEPIERQERKRRNERYFIKHPKRIIATFWLVNFRRPMTSRFYPNPRYKCLIDSCLYGFNLRLLVL